MHRSRPCSTGQGLRATDPHRSLTRPSPRPLEPAVTEPCVHRVRERLHAGLLGVVLMSGSLRLDAIIAAQAQSGVWNVLVQPLGFVVFVVAAFAEAERLPFDLPECEQELVGGYHTEYSGIKLMMYLVAEFLHMVTASFLIAILFLGGWHFWGLTGWEKDVGWPIALVRIAVLLAKVMALILFFMLARWTWARFRFDQLMNIAWKVMLPLGLVNVVAVAFWLEYGMPWTVSQGLPAWPAMAAFGWALLVLAWLAVTLVAPAASDNRPRREPSPVAGPAEEASRP